ncbi:hypothetical protein QAD02_022764 [Eretmocerus hayati]|uniref:Uncharacterized protein n=1 Tax=Eretmocerus hayati TaxID=131215 RepID=A0ACC2PYV3_9HYME|nr:hypothetical protein QAD02_022764 [Eretmocerus hayati]
MSSCSKDLLSPPPSPSSLKKLHVPQKMTSKSYSLRGNYDKDLKKNAKKNLCGGIKICEAHHLRSRKLKKSVKKLPLSSSRVLKKRLSRVKVSRKATMVRRKKIAEAIRVWQGKSTPKVSKTVNTHIKTPTAFNRECSTLKPIIGITTEQIRARLRQRKNKSFKSVNKLGITLQAVRARIEAKESIMTEELPSPQPLLHLLLFFRS